MAEHCFLGGKHSSHLIEVTGVGCLHSALLEAIPHYWRAPETYELCFAYKRLTSCWDFICCISYCFTRRFGLWLCRSCCRTGGLQSSSRGPCRASRAEPRACPGSQTKTDPQVQEVPSVTRSTEANWYHRGLTTAQRQELNLLTWGTESQVPLPGFDRKRVCKVQIPTSACSCFRKPAVPSKLLITSYVHVEEGLFIAPHCGNDCIS